MFQSVRIIRCYRYISRDHTLKLSSLFGKIMQDYPLIVRGIERDREGGGNTNLSALFVASVALELCIN
jgi:hypothetical protein